MPIITISRGSYSRGKEVAEKVAKELGYEIIAREVLVEASKEFDVDEVKLVRAISSAPSIFDRFSYAKENYIAYIRAALLEHFKKDNVVYHGLAGHFFVRDVTHALRVRIIADMDDRIATVMERDRVSKKAARCFIERIDKDRRNWSQKMYGIDTTNCQLYDLVVHINNEKLKVEDAVDIICHSARLSHLQATEESRRSIAHEALAAKVKVALIKDHPEAEVTSEDGVVHVSMKTTQANELRVSEHIDKISKAVPGVREVKVHLHWFTPFGT